MWMLTVSILHVRHILTQSLCCCLLDIFARLWTLLRLFFLHKFIAPCRRCFCKPCELLVALSIHNSFKEFMSMECFVESWLCCVDSFVQPFCGSFAVFIRPYSHWTRSKLLVVTTVLCTRHALSNAQCNITHTIGDMLHFCASS